MSEIFLLSDDHYFHANIIRYCNRPWKDVNEMNVEMERRHNFVITPDDIWICVGDLTAGVGDRKNELAMLIKRLNGKKVLVRGNHDHQKDDFYLNSGFTRVVDHLFYAGVLFSHVPGVLGVEHPHPMAQITIDYQKKYNPVLTIHGHEHRTGTPEHVNHFNCAADRHDFMPFTLCSVMDKCNLSEHTDSLYQAIQSDLA